MGDTIKFKKGPKSKLPVLALAEPGLTTDPDDLRLYIGGVKENIKIPNMQDLDNINKRISQISNPNLIINGDFRDPINQRGKKIYNTNGYTIDRWILWNANTTLTLNDGYCTIAGDYNLIVQHIEFPKTLSKKKITISAKTRGIGGPVKIAIFSLEKNEVIFSKIIDGGDWIESHVTFEMPELNNNNERLSFSIEGSGATSFDIEYFKVELGEIATPFYPRPYAEELALCQRYFVRIPSLTHIRSCITSANGFYFDVGYLTKDMRVTPTAIFGVYNEAQLNDWSVMAIRMTGTIPEISKVDTINKTLIYISRVDGINHDTADACLKFQYNCNSFFDAEIY